MIITEIEKIAARVGVASVLTLGAIGCVDLPPVKNLSTPTVAPKYTPVAIGGNLPNFDDPKLNALTGLLADHRNLQAIPNEDIKAWNEAVKKLNEKNDGLNAQRALIEAKATAEANYALQGLAINLPDQFGNVNWNRAWKFTDGHIGSAEIRILSTNEIYITDIHIPTKSESGMPLSIAQMEIIMKKEVQGTGMAASYFFSKLYPYLPQVLPEQETITVIDGLGTLTLSEIEQRKVGLQYLTQWDGVRPLTEADIDSIVMLSVSEKINHGGFPYLEPKIRALIQNKVLE